MLTFGYELLSCTLCVALFPTNQSDEKIRRGWNPSFIICAHIIKSRPYRMFSSVLRVLTSPWDEKIGRGIHHMCARMQAHRMCSFVPINQCNEKIKKRSEIPHSSSVRTHAGKIELVPCYLLLAEANLGLGRHKQAEEYLSLANWSILKNPDCSNRTKSQLYRW